MCPVCLATMGLMVAGAAASTGGLAALAVTMSRKRTGARETAPDCKEGRNQDGNEPDQEPQNRLA
jgi:hypothetical protein